jgi:hypothetical protein
MIIVSNFDMQNFTNTSPDSVDEFLSHNVSSNQKEILEFFKKFNTNAHDLYRAGIYIFLKDEMKSAKASLVYHCFYELSTVFCEIGGTNDNNSEVWSKNELKKNKPENIHTAIKGIHPEASEDRVKYISELFKSKISDICANKKHRHKLKNDDLVNDVQEFEEALGLVIPWYDETKKKLDKILQKANTPPYTKPTDNELKDTIAHLKHLEQRTLNEYFFSKLKNPEWIKLLEEKKLLYFWKDFANCYAERHLLEIADKKPDEVYDVIKLFWDDLRQDEMLGRLLYRTIFEIGIKMSKTKKECLLSVAKDFLSYLKATKSSLMHVISSKFIIDLLKTLASIGYEEKALEIFSECLKLDINAIPQHPDINEMWKNSYEKLKSKYPDFFTEPYAQRYDFVMVTRFGKDNHFSQYDYEELLRGGNEVFQQKPKELFKIYCDIIGTSLKSLSNKHKEKFLDYIYITHLATIKHEQQDIHEQHCPLCTIVSALRYCAENLLKSEDKCNAKYVFGMLQKREKENKIFLCLILHLLRLFPAVYRELIEAYITKKDCFDDINLHYEYHLLLKQEFGNLSEKGRKIIFDRIDSLGDNLESPWLKSFAEEGFQKETVRDSLKLPWLEYIKEHLSKSEQEKYKHILYKDGKEQRSQYLETFNSSKVGHPTSPLKPDKMREMSLDEIVEYLNDWIPCYENLDSKNILDSEYGLGQVLGHDVKQNTRKYLDGLLKFKGVSKPIYIVDLFSGLQGSEKTESDWKNIAELGLWTLEQKILPANKTIPCNNWTDVYITLLRLFGKDLFEPEKLYVGDEVAKSIYGIIKKLLFVSEGHLLLKKLEPNYGGLNGVTVSSLIEYAIWQHKNKKDIAYIIPMLDELLNKSEYEETWTLVGKYLPYLYFLFEDWTKQNINKILPVNDNTKFKAAWITYVIANYANSTLFDLCKDKFEYALKNKLYIADKRYMEALGRHISLHYAITKQINLGDDMMKLIFNIPELLQSMINFIGQSLKKEKWSEENINRFKSLWEWIIFNLNADNRSKYHPALKAFQFWYGYGYKSFSDREWLLDQMYNLVVKDKIDMGRSFFYNTKEALEEDLPMHAREVFEIVREHDKRMVEKDSVYKWYLTTDYIEVIKKVLGYIKNNTFEKDNSLKYEKDAFINDLGKG